MVTSYNGWPASKDPRAIGINTTWEPIPGHRFPGGVKAGDVEVVMTYAVIQLDARVEPIELYTPGDEWGWFFKMSANSPTLLSCHSSGTAIDWNATRHPNGKRRTFTADQRATIRQITQVELEGVVGWRGHVQDGGIATGTPDEMHFEIRGNAAAVKRVADRIRTGAISRPAPTPEPEDDMPLTDAEKNDIAERVYARFEASWEGSKILDRAGAAAANAGGALDWLRGGKGTTFAPGVGLRLLRLIAAKVGAKPAEIADAERG